jgi:hypothetical protein
MHIYKEASSIYFNGSSHLHNLYAFFNKMQKKKYNDSDYLSSHIFTHEWISGIPTVAAKALL